MYRLVLRRLFAQRRLGQLGEAVREGIDRARVRENRQRIGVPPGLERDAGAGDQRRGLRLALGGFLLGPPPFLNLVEHATQLLQRLRDGGICGGVEVLEQLQRGLMFPVRKPAARVADRGIDECRLSLRRERFLGGRLERQGALVAGASANACVMFCIADVTSCVW